MYENNRPILAYGLGARPDTAEEGQEFILIPTSEVFIFTKEKGWLPKDAPHSVEVPEANPAKVEQPKKSTTKKPTTKAKETKK